MEEQKAPTLSLSRDFDLSTIEVDEIVVPGDTQSKYFVKVLRKVLTTEECDQLIEISERRGYEPAKVNVGGGREKYMPDYRKSERCIIDSDEFAADLMHRIQQFIPATRRTEVAVGLNERLRFLRYDVGDFFDRHRDGTYCRGIEKGPEHEGERSRITVQIYLNYVEKGGATTVFNDFDENDTIRIVPEPGLVFLFDHSVMHDGELVEGGRKYAIRTEVMYAAADIDKY